jgi:hypothetical protein
MHNTIKSQTETPKRYQFHRRPPLRQPLPPRRRPLLLPHTTRKPVANPQQRRGRSTFDLPLPEDRSAIQHTIGQVLQRIAADDIDPRRAGLLLYGLQIASLNLPKPQPTQPELVEETTTHPELGTLAPSAEVGKAAQRKSTVTLLMEKLLEGAAQPQEQHEPTTLPTLQATADKIHSHSCNSPTPAVTLTPACRAATHLRSLPSAIGATQRPAESSHASLKTPKHLQSLRTSRAATRHRLRLFHFHATLSKERP